MNTNRIFSEITKKYNPYKLKIMYEYLITNLYPILNIDKTNYTQLESFLIFKSSPVGDF